MQLGKDLSKRDMWSAISRYVRANRVRVLLLSAAGAGAVTVAYYGRRYYQLIQAGIEAERAEGARRLRARYVSNAIAASQAAKAILPILVNALKDTNVANVDELVSGLKTNNVKDKVRRWEEVRNATFIEFVGAIYITTILNVTVSLQSNLIRRDETQDCTNREMYHSIIGKRLEEGIAELIKTIETIVKEIGTLPLKRRVSKTDMKQLIESIMDKVRSSTANLLSADYLYESCDIVPEPVSNLLDESLDLSITLDTPHVMYQVSKHVLETLFDSVEWKTSPAPCASVLAPMHTAATNILTDVPSDLQRIPAIERFGAAVFLSGELPN